MLLNILFSVSRVNKSAQCRRPYYDDFCIGTELFLYCSSREDKLQCAFWSEACIMDSRFGSLYWLRVSRRVALYLFFLQRMVVFSSSFGFPRSKLDTDFFLGAIYFSCHHKTYRHQYKKFQFYFYIFICQ